MKQHTFIYIFFNPSAFGLNDLLHTSTKPFTCWLEMVSACVCAPLDDGGVQRVGSAVCPFVGLSLDYTPTMVVKQINFWQGGQSLFFLPKKHETCLHTMFGWCSCCVQVHHPAGTHMDLQLPLYYPWLHHILQDGQVNLFYNGWPCWKKYGSITLPSLDTASTTWRDAGCLLLQMMGTSSMSEESQQLFQWLI